MNKYSFVIIFLLLSMLFLSCSTSVKEANCKSVNFNQNVFVYGRENSKINYDIDRRLIDISESIGLEMWGPDKIKKYANNNDTLTIKWYYAAGRYDVETPYKVIDKIIRLDSIHFTDQKLEAIKIKGLYGVLSVLKLKNGARVLFSGLNETTDIILYLSLKTPQFDDNAKEVFMCMLKSFQFTPQKE